MSRPSDWSALDYDSDPTPGDVVGIAALARRYADTAEAIENQATKLRAASSNSDQVWVGKAGATFRKRAGELAEHIEKAKHRYSDTASALDGFHKAIDGPQHETVRQLGLAQTARENVSSNAPLPSPPPVAATTPTPAEQEAATARARRHTAAVDALAEAKRLAGVAAGHYQDAARAAQKAIHDAVQHDGVHDSWWDRNAHWVKTALKIIAIVIVVLAVIALICVTFGAAGGFIVGLGAVLETVVAYATAISLAGHIALALTHKGSWTDVALDLVALASFGVGKLGIEGKTLFGKAFPSVMSAVKNAEKLATKVAASRAGAAAMRSSKYPGLLFKLAEHPGAVKLVNFLSPGFRTAMTDARGAAAAARAVVKIESAPIPKLLRLMANGDREAAESLFKLRQLNEVVPMVLRNQLRKAVSGYTVVAHAVADNLVVAYGGYDSYKKFWAEPHEEQAIDREVQPAISRFEVASGHVG